MTSRSVVIHLLEPEPDGSIGGADLHVLDLARSQLTQGDFAPFVLTTQSLEYSRRLRSASIPYRSASPGISMPLLQLAITTRSLPKELGACLVHSHGYESNFLAALLYMVSPHSWGALPLVMTCHGWVETKIKYRLKTHLDFFTYRWASALIICAEAQRSRLATRASDTPVHYVPNGIDPAMVMADPSIPLTSRTELGALSGDQLVCFVGRLSEEKRVLDFVLIAAALSRCFPLVRFAIAGSGPLENKLRRLVSNLGLTDRLILLGLISDIHSLYRRTTILVVPSATETTSRVTIEAGLHGVPVVASRVGGLPEILVDGVTGFLCPMGSVDEFAAKCSILLSNEPLRLSIGAAARQRASIFFSLERMRHQVEAVYNQTLHSRGRSRRPWVAKEDLT